MVWKSQGQWTSLWFLWPSDVATIYTILEFGKSYLQIYIFLRFLRGVSSLIFMIFVLLHVKRLFEKCAPIHDIHLLYWFIE